MASPISAFPELEESKIQPWKAILPSKQVMDSLQSTTVGETAWVQWMKDAESAGATEVGHPTQQHFQIFPSSGAQLTH
jgi:hypothetical protein